MSRGGGASRQMVVIKIVVVATWKKGVNGCLLRLLGHHEGKDATACTNLGRGHRGRSTEGGSVYTSCLPTSLCC
jgi:hypothetical protein